MEICQINPDKRPACSKQKTNSGTQFLDQLKKSTLTNESSKDQPQQVSLGTLSKSNPTVSNLLIQNPQFKKNCWKIIHSQINKNKAFTRISSGTSIFINPKTLELNWSKINAPKVQTTETASIPEDKPEKEQVNPNVSHRNNASFSSRLAGAVKPYLGTPYQKINCYELVVNGLQDLGVKYLGNGGLMENLMKMAKTNNLPYNAFLNGEGLIESSGTEVFSKSYNKIKNYGEQSEDFIKNIKPLLNRGYILSFSTPTKGHTGVIGQDGNTWTFINSGELDHTIGSKKINKGVGEEDLSSEIRNWFKRAQHNNESLLVTLGKLNENKLAGFYRPSQTMSKKA